MNITIQDIIDSNEKHPGAVLHWKPKDFRDNKTKNKKAKFDVTWVNLKFIMASGKKVPCRLKLKNQIIASGAKAPQTSDDGDEISAFTIQFRSMTRDDIKGGDYVPRPRETEEEKAKEEKRVDDFIDGVLERNAELIKAIDILNTSFQKIAKEIIEAGKNKELEFTVRKDRKKNEIPIFLIKQSTRYDEDTKEDVPIEPPIFRVKLEVYKKDPARRIGRWDYFKDQFRPTVFDARKTTKTSGRVPAYVRQGKKKVELNKKNVAGFITYKSIITGTINFDTATISKAGISFGNHIHEMFIMRHKTTNTSEAVSIEDITDMRGDMLSDEEGSDVETGKAGESDVGTDDEGGHEDKPEDKADDTSDGEDLGGDDPENLPDDPPSEPDEETKVDEKDEEPDPEEKEEAPEEEAPEEEAPEEEAPAPPAEKPKRKARVSRKPKK